MEPTTSETPTDKAISTSQSHWRFSRPLQISKAALLLWWHMIESETIAGDGLGNPDGSSPHTLPPYPPLPIPSPGPRNSTVQDSHLALCTRQLLPLFTSVGSSPLHELEINNPICRCWMTCPKGPWTCSEGRPELSSQPRDHLLPAARPSTSTYVTRASLCSFRKWTSA